MSKLLVLLILEGSDNRVGTVTSLDRLKNSINYIQGDEIEVVITDCYKVKSVVGERHIDYLLLNEPPIDIQDKHEGYQKWYFDVVDSLKANEVGIQLHGEHSTHLYDSKYDKYWYEMLSRINDSIYQITPELARDSGKMIRDAANRHSIANNLGTTFSDELDNCVSVLPSMGILNTNVVMPVKSSFIDVCWAARIAPSKKPVNFLRLMALVYPNHPGFLMYGDLQPGIHNVALNAQWDVMPFTRDGLEVGAYNAVYEGNNIYSNPSKGHRVVWGGTQIGKGDQCNFYPRLELAVLEGLQSCSIPILFNETVPEWMPKDAYIGINWTDINHISKVDGLQKSADLIRSRIDEIKALSPSKVESICSNALEVIQHECNVRSYYNEFIYRVLNS